MTKKTKLPKLKLAKKPSALIVQALADLAAVEKMKAKYKVDMGDWHNPLMNEVFDEATQDYKEVSLGKCSVCFAGSVMAMGGADPDLNITPDAFPEDVANRLEALNHFRTGEVSDAFRCLGRDTPRFLQTRVEVVEYEDDPKQFKKDMLALARVLEAVGE